MQVSAKLKNLRVSPRKTRLVAGLVRGKDIDTARNQLQFSKKKTSENILCLLNSAVANAKNNFNLEENNLFVSSIVVEEGPTLKRWTPRAMGRASAIHKRTCSVIIVLDEIEKKEEKKVSAKKAARAEEVKADAKSDKAVAKEANEEPEKKEGKAE